MLDTCNEWVGEILKMWKIIVFSEIRERKNGESKVCKKMRVLLNLESSVEIWSELFIYGLRKSIMHYVSVTIYVM